jgi:hypothetical protein
MITKGLGASSLLITQGLGRKVTVVVLVDPYCNSMSPYKEHDTVYMPFSKLGACLSELVLNSNIIVVWPSQLKLT